jgi:formylglycine-generating enzyme required for sulfatase activity
VDKPVPAIATASLILPGGIPLEFCRIPAGTFWMGSREPVASLWHPWAPRHQVRITRDFWLGQCPVTVSQFKVFLEDAGLKWNKIEPGIDEQPVVKLYWNDAMAFCDWLNDCRMHPKETANVCWPAGLEEHVATLPTEAEWERACRGATGDNYVEQEFGCGDGAEALSAVASLDLKSDGVVTHVKQNRPTDWGLHDLHGLVREWCYDEYSDDAYTQRGAMTVDPGAQVRVKVKRTFFGAAPRVVRGSSRGNSLVERRCAYRFGNTNILDLCGFRVALVSDSSDIQSFEDQLQAQPGLGHAARRQAVAEWERRGGAGSAAEPDEFGAGVVPPEWPDGPPTSGP